MHLLHPVAEPVGDEPKDVGLPHVERVAAARVVDVRPARPRAVEGVVVYPAERQCWSIDAALTRVVVDDVEDYLDTGIVKRLDERLELRDLLARRSCMGVVGVRCEIRDRVVAPIVRTATA